MPSPMRVTVFTLGGLVLAGGIGMGAFTGLVVLSSHDVDASKEFAFTGDSLTIVSDGGGVHLTPGNDGVVNVDRTTTESINGADPKWSLENGKLALETNCSSFVNFTCDGDYKVTVPKAVKTVIVRSDDGGISVDRMAATSFDLRSDNGSVKFRDSTSTLLRMESDNGSISVNRSEATRVDAKSDNGSVKMTLNNEPDWVQAESDNGGIRLTIPRSERYYDLTLDTDNGSKHGEGVILQRQDSVYKLDLKSDNGSVRAEYAEPTPTGP